MEKPERDKNCFSYWFPKLKAAGLPVPRTVITETEVELVALLDGESPSGFTLFLEQLRAAGDQLGWPAFLRTGHTSGKHHWKRTCYLPSADKLSQHVAALVELSACADVMGLPTNVWCMREMLPTKPVFTAPAFGDMPICREFRAFVDGGEVKCLHPYWPHEALMRGFPSLRADSFEERHELPCDFDLPDDFEEKYAALSDLGDDEETIRTLASQAGAALGGTWSVDLLDTDRGWYVTDVAEAARSFHWEGCAAKATV
jgi:hypothetical protein